QVQCKVREGSEEGAFPHEYKIMTYIVQRKSRVFWRAFACKKSPRSQHVRNPMNIQPGAIMQNQESETNGVEKSLQDSLSTDQKERADRPKQRMNTRLWALVTLIAFLGGSFGGYFTGVHAHEAD